MPTRYLIVIALLSLLHCGSSVPFADETTMARPVGISVSAASPLTFSLNYFVQNQEETFLGYNVYISRSTIGDSEARVGSGVPALVLDGSLPTYKHFSSEFSADSTISKAITVFNDGHTAFESGVDYFFRITAYSRQNVESPPSNEVSGTALP